MPKTDYYWKAIAQFGGGEYFHISGDGGVKVVTTPYDDKLYELNKRIDKTYITYGSFEERSEAVKKFDSEKYSMEAAPVEAKASRAINKAINKYSYSKEDLVQAVENNEISLKDIKDNELPENMQKMSLKAREGYIQSIIDTRKEIREEISYIESTLLFIESSTDVNSLREIEEELIKLNYIKSLHNKKKTKLKKEVKYGVIEGEDYLILYGRNKSVPLPELRQPLQIKMPPQRKTAHIR